MRKRKVKQRPIPLDPVYNDALAGRFVNMLMKDGKKSVAYKVFYDAIAIVEEKMEDDPEESGDDKTGSGGKTGLDVWKEALSAVMPHVEVKASRIGGSTLQVPRPIRASRKISTAMKWLIGYARKRNEKSMAQRLASEVLAAAKEEGAAVKKRVDTHKMAEANKAFSHFRF